MNGVMGRVLGEGWASLHPGLQAHHRLGASCDDGHMDVEFPRFMAPVLAVLGWCGILVNRAEAAVHTVVHKHMEAEGLQWRRTLTFANGRRLHFNSVWTNSREGELVEYVNRVLGLRMADGGGRGRRAAALRRLEPGFAVGASVLECARVAGTGAHRHR